MGGDRFPAPPGVDVATPNAARIYDYFLGGAHNFESDRERAAAIESANPHMAYGCRANRTFLRLAVSWCLARGIDQFLDLGSGIPTVGNVHEIALATNPLARVAYVDVEPVAVAHAAELVADLPTVTVTHADLRDPGAVLRATTVSGLLDLTRPVALLALAVLHFVPGRLPELLGRYRDALVPGGAVVVSHVSDDLLDPALAARTREGVAAYRHTATPVTLRSTAELHELLAGLDLTPPGLVDIVDWPEAQPDLARTGAYGAVARVVRPGGGASEPRAGSTPSSSTTA